MVRTVASRRRACLRGSPPATEVGPGPGRSLVAAAVTSARLRFASDDDAAPAARTVAQARGEHAAAARCGSRRSRGRAQQIARVAHQRRQSTTTHRRPTVPTVYRRPPSAVQGIRKPPSQSGRGRRPSGAGRVHEIAGGGPRRRVPPPPSGARKGPVNATGDQQATASEAAPPTRRRHLERHRQERAVGRRAYQPSASRGRPPVAGCRLRPPRTDRPPVRPGPCPAGGASRARDRTPRLPRRGRSRRPAHRQGPGRPAAAYHRAGSTRAGPRRQPAPGRPPRRPGGQPGSSDASARPSPRSVPFSKHGLRRRRRLLSAVAGLARGRCGCLDQTPARRPGPQPARPPPARCRCSAARRASDPRE